MDNMIKASADSNDLTTLKYIFVDALEADPTFVRYEEEYSYCKSIPDLLEPHQELTPFSQNPGDWNEEYWTGLKMDLLRNFSDCRMMHMKEVAQVFLAEKVARILKEREDADMDLGQEQEFAEAESVTEIQEPVPKVTESVPERPETAAEYVGTEIPVNNNPEIIRAEMESRRREAAERFKEEALRLGAEAVQIASNSRYIFKLTDSHQWLIRYRYSGKAGGNEVTNLAMFRLVPRNDPRVWKLGGLYQERFDGQSSFAGGIRYRIFAIIVEDDQGCRRVAAYKLLKQTGVFFRQQTESYYVRELFCRN